MGTDIHAIVQRREGEGWVNVDMTWPETRYRFEHPLLGRNYDAFAILGNVRNGTGFAGIYTSDGFDPISDDRGFPRDFIVVGEDGYVRCDVHQIKPDVLARIDDEDFEDPVWYCEVCTWMGDHSFTWITARELIDYDWNAPVRKRMVIDWPTYKAWAIDGGREGFPRDWCGDVSGAKVVKIKEDSIAEYGTAFIDKQIADGNSVYVEAFHSYPRSMAARKLHDEVIPWLESLGDPDDIRIVMGFDS